LFAPVEHFKHGRAAKFRWGLAGVVPEEGSFDFDDFRAQIGKQAGGVRAGEEAGEVEDSDLVEGCHEEGDWILGMEY